MHSKFRLTCRICLVALLAVLLPIRGAMAAATVCPLGGMAGEHRMAAASAMTAAHHECDACPHDDGRTQNHGHHTAGDAACPLCAAFCSASAMPASLPVMPAPPLCGARACDAPDAASPSFIPDGPERPPRSI